MRLFRPVTFREFLIGLCVVTLVYGCTNYDPSALRARYEAERLYHHAEKQFSDFRFGSQFEAPATKRVLATSYAAVFDHCLSSLTKIDSSDHPVEHRELQYLAFQSSTRLGQMLFSLNLFDSCKTVMHTLMDRIWLDSEQRLSTYLNLGQILQAAQNWDSAQVYFDQALRFAYPPRDRSGEIIINLFNLPTRIYRMEKLLGDSVAALNRYQTGLAYYSSLIDHFPGTDLEQAAHNNLAGLYLDREHFDKAVEELSKITDSTGNIASWAKVQIADLYRINTRDYKRALNLYTEILEDIPTTDSIAFPEISFRKARVLMSLNKYFEARDLIVRLKANYRLWFSINPLPQYAIARSWELEGNWNRAEIEYQFLIDHFTVSEEAMSTYLYVAQRYEDMDRKSEAELWYGRADEAFSDLATRGSGRLLEARALEYKANLLQKQKKWELAAEIFEKIFARFPHTDPGQRGLLKAAALYQQKLDNPERAEELVTLLRAAMTGISDDEN